VTEENDKQPRVAILRSGPAAENGRLLNEIRMFREAGYDVSVCCWDRKAEYPARDEIHGATVRNCHYPGSYGGTALYFRMPGWWLRVLRHLRSEGPDIIHAVDFDTVVPALWFRRFHRTPVVFDIYDFFSAKSRRMPAVLKPLVTKWEQACARRADAVIIVDEARKYLLGKTLPETLVVAENCAYDGVDPSWRKPESGPLTIFYAGLIARHRGLEKLVKVTGEVEGVHVIIAGSIKEESFRALFDDAPHVEYIGPISHADVIERTFHADAVYSYYDPHLEINRLANSTKMFEAFMCGTAVLANSEPASAAIVREQRCGFALPYDDDQGLREAIVAYRGDRELARQHGANGRRLFEERFDWAVVSRRILEVYGQLGIGPG